MNSIDELFHCLIDMDYSIFDEDYINQLLDSRDIAPFDTEWCRVSQEIEALKNIQNYTSQNKNEQEKVREKAFMIITENTPDSELSAYISDDFGLIYDSLIVSYQDPWLDKLILAYKNKTILTGEL